MRSSAVQRREDRPVDGTSLAMGAAAACFPSLPDVLEPAVHPNHRKFFHSVTFAVALGFGMRRACTGGSLRGPSRRELKTQRTPYR